MLSRNITVKINWALDNLLPPIIREWKPLMNFIIRFAYGDKTNLILDFKERYPDLTETDIDHYYELISNVPINFRATDINKQCLNFIIAHCSEGAVLDVGCGRGYLLNQLSQQIKASFIGVDVTPPHPDGFSSLLQFTYGKITDLPFENNSFDTVLCTHTLEHIRNYKVAIDELLRVCKKGGIIIIVIPKQREYRYTADLHVNFCPYLYRFKEFVGLKDAEYMELNGDFVCLYHKK